MLLQDVVNSLQSSAQLLCDAILHYSLLYIHTFIQKVSYDSSTFILIIDSLADLRDLFLGGNNRQRLHRLEPLRSAAGDPRLPPLIGWGRLWLSHIEPLFCRWRPSHLILSTLGLKNTPLILYSHSICNPRWSHWHILYCIPLPFILTYFMLTYY